MTTLVQASTMPRGDPRRNALREEQEGEERGIVPDSITFNQTTEHEIQNVGFGDLPLDKVHEIFKDGRVFSHFIEHHISQKFPLTHVDGCKDHDFVDNGGVKYDEKTFTKKGLKFMPSSMIGTGRKFDRTEFERKTKDTQFVVVSNAYFPRVLIRFMKGADMLQRFPNGTVPFNQHDEFFQV